MIINKVFGIREIDESKFKLRERTAVRAVIISGGKILMLHTNKGDYKFPGGGAEKGETHAACLTREVAEETGYFNAVAGEKTGVVIERKLDEYEADTFFQMTSHYYFCKVPGEKSQQKLDGYEAEQEFTPVWIYIEEAIRQNEAAAKEPEHNGWIQRETFVLKELLKFYGEEEL
ncbi:NUDIX domain-containing protein [Evansella clarkii]|uniref:NUDIX domain-containing protein n=1 Tax=Evansella clarkii TaxID=79879 RepID=UPI000B452EE2|nr:NUDIX domain-containing protein [Evansella clarkii]